MGSLQCSCKGSCYAHRLWTWQAESMHAIWGCLTWFQQLLIVIFEVFFKSSNWLCFSYFVMFVPTTIVPCIFWLYLVRLSTVISTFCLFNAGNSCKSCNGFSHGKFSSTCMEIPIAFVAHDLTISFWLRCLLIVTRWLKTPLFIEKHLFVPENGESCQEI